MKGWQFDLILVACWFAFLFIFSIWLSTIVVVVIYFIFRNKVDYSKGDKKNKKQDISEQQEVEPVSRTEEEEEDEEDIETWLNS